MNRYELQEHLGDGTYGCVLKAVKKSTGEVVAIKKLKRKFGTFDECLDLREVRTLRDLAHQNIVKLIEVIPENDSTLFFVFEHMEANLFEVMKHYQNAFAAQTLGGMVALGTAGGLIPMTAACGPTIIPEVKIRSILYQVLQALSFMHQRGYFHRDIKPENILVKNDVVKIADLGLAREIRSRPPYTDYVSTRWYRAPEVLLRSSSYNSPIDLFAVGCILAELYTIQPLFPGSSEIDQIDRICRVLGAPTIESWPEGFHLVKLLDLKILASVGQQRPIWAQQGPVQIPLNTVDSRLQNALPQMTHRAEALDLLKGMLMLNPRNRLSARKALDHPFFKADLLQGPTTATCLGNQYASSVSVISQAQPLLNPQVQQQQVQSLVAPSLEQFNSVGIGGASPFSFNPMQQWVDESKKCLSGSSFGSSGQYTLPLHLYSGVSAPLLLHETPVSNELENVTVHRNAYPFSSLVLSPSTEVSPHGGTRRASIDAQVAEGTTCSGQYARGIGSDPARANRNEGIAAMSHAGYGLRHSFGDSAAPSSGFGRAKF